MSARTSCPCILLGDGRCGRYEDQPGYVASSVASDHAGDLGVIGLLTVVFPVAVTAFFLIQRPED